MILFDGENSVLVSANVDGGHCWLSIGKNGHQVANPGLSADCIDGLIVELARARSEIKPPTNDALNLMDEITRENSAFGSVCITRDEWFTIRAAITRSRYRTTEKRGAKYERSD